ncbi:MAG TPA: nucleotidyltransferase [Bacteroidales bacterium]|nr:nucleotidyltransferase [Bacteroidales bacterium]
MNTKNETKPTLLVLAAGMGSRYGGLKQLDKVGTSGETIIDYSVYDAIRAGFGKIVFIIRKSIEEDFKQLFDHRFPGVEVQYVFQETDNLPKGYKMPDDRVKPWGTGHAVLMAANAVNEPFCVINADDFYGADAFNVMAEFLRNLASADENSFSMVGYYLKNTLSENGSVSRGVCEVKNSFLVSVTERTKIERFNSFIEYVDDEGRSEHLTGDEVVSMNFWGFPASAFKHFETGFKTFLNENISNNKSEFYIPLVVNNLLQEKTITLKVLESNAKWFGVTYQEDRPGTVESIRQLVAEGEYPESLWA